MKPRYVAVIIALLLPACTFTPVGNDREAEFHPPLVYQHWTIEHFTLEDGSAACSISSGYNGMTVTLRRRQGQEEFAVESTRAMTPGVTFSVNVGSHRFETYNTFFPEKTARQIVAQLSEGQKAYLEWTEFSGPTNSPVHIQNVVQLADFRAQLKACRGSLE